MEKYKTLLKQYIANKNICNSNMMEYFTKLRECCNLKPTKSFYRYRKISEYTLSEILHQHVYLSELDKFDDIYEGKYLISQDDVRNGKDHVHIDNCNDYYNYHVRLASYTEDNYNIPMWYYYADKHQGICIEYKYGDMHIPDDMVFLPVYYPTKEEVDDYKYLPDDVSYLQYGAYMTCLTKDEYWNFEREWRLINVLSIHKPFGLENNAFLKSTVKNIEKIKPIYFDQKMYAIHFGANVTRENKEIIKNIIEKNKLNIKLKEMVMTDTGICSFDYGEIPEKNQIRL